MDTANLVAVVRSRGNLEEQALQLAAVDGLRSSPLQRFVCRPLGFDLALVLAHDSGDGLTFVNASELARLGLDANAAIELGWSNSMRKLAGKGDMRFEAMPAFGWMPAIAGSDECVTLLAQPDALRSLPVAGRHLVFAPHTRGFWITGDKNHSGIRLLCRVAANEYANAGGKSLTTVPYLLDDKGRWTAWQPTPDDPSFWPIRELQILQDDALYEAQRLTLRRQSENDPAAPHYARFAADRFQRSGEDCAYSLCVWGDCTTLLPKTDIVELKPLLNRAELERDPNAAPRFGASIRVPWDALAGRLQPQGMYPERYLAASFPSEAEFGRLAQRQVHDPAELFPAGRVVPRSSPALPGAEPTTSSAPPSKNSGGLLLALGAIAAAFVLFVSCAGVAVALFLLSGPPRRVAVGPTPIPSSADVDAAVREQQEAVDRTLEALKKAQQELDAAAQTPNGTPLAEFPELPTPETPLPALTVEARESVSVANPRPAGSYGFQDQPEEDGWLVGLRVVTGQDWGGVLRGIQPIYQQENRYTLGKYIGDPGGISQEQLLAKPGYAISSVEIQRGLVFNALRVTFSRVTAESRLDLKDSYQSDWVGLDDGRKIEAISGEGLPIIGIEGMYQQGCFGDISLVRSKPQ